MTTAITALNDDELKDINGGFGIWDFVSAVVLPPGVGVFIDVLLEPSKAGDFPTSPTGGTGGPIPSGGGDEGSGGHGGD